MWRWPRRRKSLGGCFDFSNTLLDVEYVRTFLKASDGPAGNRQADSLLAADVEPQRWTA